jgi:hypothetical protein
MMNPTQCHLWKKETLVSEDLYYFFDQVKTYTEDSHFSRRLVKCKDCGQLYLKEFYEEIDWIDGEDPQYSTFIPVRNEEEAEIISKVNLFEFQTFYPSLKSDYPKEGPKRTYWVGK